MMKTKFNIVDVIIIFIIIAAIAVGCLFYFKSNNKSTDVISDTTKIQFTLEVKDLSETAAKGFEKSEGYSASFGETATGTGKVIDVDIVDYEKWVENTEEGTINIQKIPDRYTVKVTIESDVIKSDTAYTSGSESICVGKEMPFNSYGVGAEEDCYIIYLSEVK